MSTMRLGAACATLLTASAVADVSLDLRFSTDGGVTWATEASVLPGSTVRVGVIVEWEGYYDVAAATFRIRGAGLAVGDAVAFAPGTATGRMPGYDFGAASNAIYRAGDGLRIDAASDPGDASESAGAGFANGSSGPHDPQGPPNPANPFAFEITIASDAVGPYDITLTLDQLNRGVMTMWAQMNDPRPITTVPTIDGGVLRVLPGPGAAAVLGAAVLPGRRRRGGRPAIA